MKISASRTLSLINTIPVLILGGFDDHIVAVHTKIPWSQIRDLIFSMILSFTPSDANSMVIL